ncbi:hypothetical protein Klosneuvirus_6_91 [Klosneuvirus KNV1]|uniref:Uncharacterized protein n=1 Tax=Klosneuvirus KNV1 TaxID=1977640 RepID=A0A1V0SLA5_9VIRU|nr:hypothetical protein Klosneuvirus_6_91 [Klosneuvirus KNV1]
MSKQLPPNKKRILELLNNNNPEANQEPPNKKPRIEEEDDHNSSESDSSQSDSDAMDEYPYDLMVSFQSTYTRMMNKAKPAPVNDLSNYVSWIVEMLHQSLEKGSLKTYFHFKMDKNQQNILCSTSANLTQTECILGKAHNTVVREVLSCDNKREPVESLQRVLELSHVVMASAPESVYLNPLPNYTVVVTFKPQQK